MLSGVVTRASTYEIVGGRPGTSVSSMRTGSKYSESGSLDDASQKHSEFHIVSKACARMPRR